MSDPPLEIRRLGLLPYEEARMLQEDLLRERADDRVGDTLLLLEHPAVITLGRGTRPGTVLDGTRIPVVESERGGDVTLHAPGQAVGYLIRKLLGKERDLHAHLRLIEEILIGALDRFGIAGKRWPGRTGVWVLDRKIASIGVACRSWCTWHGFALNVSNDLGLFAAIRPCGFDARVMTSVERETGVPAPMDSVFCAIEAAALEAMVAGRRVPGRS